jgi:hypothetical protein
MQSKPEALAEGFDVILDSSSSMLHWDLNTLISELSPQYLYTEVGPGPDTQASQVRG